MAWTARRPVRVTKRLLTGVCYNCDGTGHKANNCPKKTGSSKSVGGKGKPQGKFTDNCTHCGKKGHKAETCWEKSENAGKMP
jgi:hypothetical protein